MFAPNFTEFVVVNAHGVFSAHVAHDLDTNRAGRPVAPSPADGLKKS